MTVFAPDDRTLVTDTTVSPHSAIVHIRVDFDGDGVSDGSGSGAMISPDDVLTAGHVLWSPTHGYAKNIWVSPALNGSLAPFGMTTGANWHVPSLYVSTNGHTSYDIGVINLSTAIGDSTGTFALRPGSARSLQGTVLTTAGYPGDKSGGVHQYTASGEVDQASGTKIYYNDTLDSFGGQSGSPLWITVDGTPTIVAVHTSGGTVYNAGTAITTSSLFWIADWTGGDITNPSTPTVSGSTGSDLMAGGDGNDTLSGLSGDDTLHGFQGDDTLVGGAGDDKVYGYEGSDSIGGGDGNDQLHGGEDSDSVSGGAGDDLLYGNRGADLLSGGSGADTLYGGQNDWPPSPDGAYRAGIETVYGGDGDDVLYGNLGTDGLYGEDGADLLFGGQDDDTLSGGGGDDALWGNLGSDILAGGDGNDTLHGGGGNDTLSGGSGDDLLHADDAFAGTGSDADSIDGGSGIDTAVYLHALSSYSIERLSPTSIRIDGADTLSNVEYLQFSDTIVAVDSLF